MNIQDALIELGQQLGLPELDLTDSASIVVEFDDDLVVTFETTSDQDSLRLSAVVGPLDTDEAALERLLHANLLGLATGGAHFSVDQGTESLMIERTVAIGALDFTAFSQVTETFINQLEGWRDELGKSSSSTDTPTSDHALLRV